MRAAAGAMRVRPERRAPRSTSPAAAASAARILPSCQCRFARRRADHRRRVRRESPVVEWASGVLYPSSVTARTSGSESPSDKNDMNAFEYATGASPRGGGQSKPDRVNRDNAESKSTAAGGLEQRRDPMITGRRRHLRCSAAGQTSNASTGVRALLSEQRRQTGRLHPRTMPAGPACREARSTGVHTEPCAISASPADEPAPASSDAAAAMLVPGRNCWRIERAERVAFLVDGEEYFTAVRSALAKARHSIFILGWDIDSRMRLVPDGANDGLPEPLGDFLNASRRSPSRAARLRAVVGFRDALRDGARVAADLQARLAHASAVDVPPRRQASGRARRTTRRSSSSTTRSHSSAGTISRGAVGTRASTRARIRGASTIAASRMPRFTTSVSSSPATARAHLAISRSERWLRATGSTCATHRRRRSPRDAWPDGVAIEATSIDVAIARTEPAFDGRPGVARDPGVAPRRDRRRANGISLPRTSISLRARSPRRSPGACEAAERPRSPCCRRTRKAAGSRFPRWAFCDPAFIACCVRRIATHAIVSIARCCAGSATARAASTYTARC